MILKLSVLCPVDFSETSRRALRYAGGIAEYIGARLTILAVNDAGPDHAASLAEPLEIEKQIAQQIERFARETFVAQPGAMRDAEIEVATGHAAEQILRVARDRACDLIVMSSHGRTGFRKLFFGATTERVLRETHVPVLVTPRANAGALQLEDARRIVRRVLAPLDLTAATPHQVSVAGCVAEALGVPIMLLHVLEPVRSLVVAQPHGPDVEIERRYRAERALQDAIDRMPPSVKPEAVIAYGEPAEEIAKVATDRDAGLIVMGLHSSPLPGPRMGSVTYQMLCLLDRLVLALPPVPAPAARLTERLTAAARED